MKNRLIFVPAAVILLTLFIVGTFLDLQISQGFSNLNAMFPKAMTGFALLPLCLMIAFVGGSMIKVIMSKRYKTWYQNTLVGLFGLVCICFATYLYGKEMCSLLAFNLAKKFIIPIGLCASIPGGLGGFFLFKYVDQKDYMKKIIYLSIILFISFGIVWVMKKLAPRVRYAVVAVNGDVLYRPWYKPDLTQELVDSIIKSSSFGKEATQSFPSGHSSSAMLTLMLINSLPMFINKLKGKEKYLFYIGFAYYCFIALMRLYAGAHYLTDITFSGLVALSVYFIGNEIYLRKLSKGGLSK